MSKPPRELTEKEMRKRFLDQMRQYVRYWATLKDPHCVRGESDVEARLNGLAFSFLNILDGTSMGLPSIDLVPHPHESDKPFLIDQGENYWPPSPLPAGTKTIHGDAMLHECWYEKDDDDNGR